MVDKEKVKKSSLSENAYHYHESQFKQPKRSTIALGNFVEKILLSTKTPYSAIDIGCGGGANMYYLSKILSETKWTGLDFAEKWLLIAKQYLSDYNKFKFIQGDFYNLTKMFPWKSFDLTFSIQNLSWLPKYEDALEEIFEVTKKWIFVTSLFSDFKVDVFSNVFQYNDDWSVEEDSPYNYNIYSFGRFKDYCIEHGAKEVIAEDFILDIDLPVPESMQMGTYTIKKMDGIRLQFSGPLSMPWKMIAIRME